MCHHFHVCNPISSVKMMAHEYKFLLISDFTETEGNQLPDQLEQFLLHVAKTGDTL